MSQPTSAPAGDAGISDARLWCMHIAGPDDIHAAPDFWTALAWPAAGEATSRMPEAGSSGSARQGECQPVLAGIAEQTRRAEEAGREIQAVDLALAEGCGVDSPRGAMVADWIGKCHGADEDRKALAAEVERLRAAPQDIADMGPATAEMTLAHEMAQMATDALMTALLQPEGADHAE